MSKIDRVREALDARYGRKDWAHRVPILDELIVTILSQNTTAANCNEAFRSLSERFPMWDDAMRAPWQEIAEAIRVGGLANRKAPRIKRILEEVHEATAMCSGASSTRELSLEWLAEVPDAEAIDYLMGFDGVGRKTAACVLMFALGRPVLPVDTHVHRVATRLGLIGKMSADKAHDALQAMVRPKDVYSFHMNMVTHGRQVCHARGPDCPSCMLDGDCDYRARQAGAR